MSDKKQKREKGVTLIELMVVLVIAAILVGGVYTLFTTQQRSYSVQDQVTGVQQDARAALTILARDIRMAGVLIGSGGFNVNGAQFAITPTNGGSGNTDSITVAYATDEFLSSSGDPVTITTISSGSDVTLSADASGFFDTGTKKFVAFEGDNTVYEISNVSTNTITLTQSPPVYLENVGARVFRVKAITYTVTTLGGTPGLGVLRRNENTGDGAQPLVGDGTTTFVEDLQFAYQVAGVDDYWTFDGQTTGSEGNDTAFPAGSTNADIRMVRINIIVRTVVPDPEETGFFKPASEDNPQSNTDTGCRRRVYTTVVKARNL
jgi:prepilin-type N-terminal cleavage/methylation domain-containing protein